MTEYRNPKPTVDIVIVRDQSVVLVERKNPPHGWALPGGFVDEGETLEAAAVREALEETGLNVVLDEQFYSYSDPSRDPRLHTITTVFIGHAQGTPKGGDDAAKAQYWAFDAVPEVLCFDHEMILAQVRRFLTTGKRPTPTSG